MTKKKEVKVKLEESINIQQACNEFKIVRTVRTHVLKKFRDEIYTKDEWENIFKEQRVLNF